MRTLLPMRTERTSLWVSVAHLSFEDYFSSRSLSHGEKMVIFYILCVSHARTWNSDKQCTGQTARTARVSHVKQTPASALASEAFKFRTDADSVGPATLRGLSISVYAARTSKSGLVQNDRTAGEMLPKVGNSIALPLLFPYKSKVAHLAALPVPNYFSAMSFC